MKRVLAITLIVCVLVTVAVSTASASAGPQQDPAPIEVPSLVNALSMLASGLGVGAIVSFLFERFAFFQKLEANAKWWIIFLASVGLPVLARLLLDIVPPDIWARVEPYWQAFMVGLLTWAGSQIVHGLANRNKPADGATPPAVTTEYRPAAPGQ